MVSPTLMVGATIAPPEGFVLKLKSKMWTVTVARSSRASRRSNPRKSFAPDLRRRLGARVEATRNRSTRAPNGDRSIEMILVWWGGDSAPPYRVHGLLLPDL